MTHIRVLDISRSHFSESVLKPSDLQSAAEETTRRRSEYPAKWPTWRLNGSAEDANTLEYYNLCTYLCTCVCM